MSDTQGTSLTILVIDDDESDRLHAMRCIRQSALTCTLLEASDISPALERHGTASVDLILLDYHLPTGDALSALSQFHAQWPNAACVLTTGDGSEVLVARAFRSGICDYISKNDISARSIRRVIENGVKARRLELQLTAQTEELKSFAHVLAHDVKAPLRAIRNLSGWASESLGDGDTATALSELTYISQSAARLDALVDSLRAHLDFDHVPQFAAEDAGDLARQAVDNLRLEISDGGAEVQINNLPMIHADKRQVIQLFQNLIANGLKFSNAATPRVTITAALLERDFHTICVADNGIGVSPDQAERIFEPFKRLHAQDEFAGSGLGLATCRKIVSRHGGRIWCDTTTRGGARFQFSLPAASNTRLSA